MTSTHDCCYCSWCGDGVDAYCCCICGAPQSEADSKVKGDMTSTPQQKLARVSIILRAVIGQRPQDNQNVHNAGLLVDEVMAELLAGATPEAASLRAQVINLRSGLALTITEHGIYERCKSQVLALLDAKETTP